ncbi:MAG: DUF1489 domain-containing protein [Pseudomonadota bacterium]
MPLHLVKLCVGAASVDDQAQWVRRRTADNKRAGRGARHDCVTRMRPRRTDELLDGGSIYWVIKGVIMTRQTILAIEPRAGADGIERTAIMLEPQLFLTQPAPRRAFQGWRYLKPEDAPDDIKDGAGEAPPELVMALADLGLL